MVKTGATPKVSYVTPSPADEPTKTKAQTVEGDAYSSGLSNTYNSLINGKPKAESIDGGVINEMYEASSKQGARKNDYHSHMQNLIGSLMIGEARERPAYDTVGNIPYVPDLQGDILKNTAMHKNMKPIVERYAALEKVLITMFDNLRVTLHPSKMSQMTASEIRSLRSYAKKLNATLGECRTELKMAHQIYQQQIKEAQALAAEEAAEEA
ncbi:MAG: hypothetical protein ABH871_09325 [Pseudomonadota bacterium]